MTVWRRVIFVVVTIWVLVATNPGSSGTRSFQHFLSELDDNHQLQYSGNEARDITTTMTTTTASTASNIDTINALSENGREKKGRGILDSALQEEEDGQRRECHAHGPRKRCIESRRAYGELSELLESLFAPHRRPLSPLHTTTIQHFESIDYAIFTLIRSKALAKSPEDDAVTATHGFLGILGMWLPYPDAASLIGSTVMDELFFMLRSNLSPLRVRLRTLVNNFRLPARPWEWLTAVYVICGIVWLVFPARCHEHMTLTWPNFRIHGRWWCLLLSQFSHGGSLLRLCRSVVMINFVAPRLVTQHELSLSSFYGSILTACATGTALAILVLVRRYVLSARQAWPRLPLEINCGGSCIYALLVIACLGRHACEAFTISPVNKVQPFELLMMNILFDSFFLAGKWRIADYTAHTGAALGSWLFYSVNLKT